MEPFRFAVTTPIYFGSKCIENNADFFKGLGKRAYVITSKFLSGCRNFALEDVKFTLESQGIDYRVNVNVIENPPVSSISELTADVREYHPDFLIAPGGGSAIDTAKAVSVLLKYPDKDPISVFYGTGLPFGKTVSAGSLPLVAVPTTAGTGADITGFSVLTREDTQTKLAIGHQVFPDATFLDAKYIAETPPVMTHSGALDALSHGAETYVNITSNFMSRSLAEIGFRLFAEFKDGMLLNKYTFEQREKMLLAASIQGMAFMQAGTCLPHGMSYPLSHYKQIPHGIACGAILGEYLRAFKNRSSVESIARMCGFADIDEFADYIKQLVADYIRIDVTDKEILQWGEEFFELKYRLKKHPEPITLEEIVHIYRNTLLT